MPTPRSDTEAMPVAELGMDVRLNGRAQAPVEVSYVRDLGEADLALLASERGVKPQPVQRLRDRHHSLARLLAGGMKPAEVSAITGYSLSRISILQADPSVKELISFYRENEDAAYAEFGRRATMVTITALENLQEQVEDDANPLSVDQNLTIIKTLADRTGHAPVSKTINTNVNLELGSRMAAARARLQQRLTAPVAEVIDAHFEVRSGDSVAGDDTG